MDRRRFLFAWLAGTLAAAPTVAGQQAGRLARVGVLSAGLPSDWLAAFRARLRELGWVEKQNLVLDVRYAAGKYDQLPGIAAELVASNPDVIFATAIPAIVAASRATTTIPIVIETLGDAVGSGLVRSLARPGTNVTGVSGFAPELGAKRLQLIRDILPRSARIGVLVNGSNPVTPSVIRALEAAARDGQIRLDLVDVRDPEQLQRALDTIAARSIEALVIVSDPMFFDQRRQIIDLTARHRLPTVYEVRSFVENGGLLSYGPGDVERFERAAVYVDRILRGARAADLPIEQPTKFELVINLQTAKALGLTIPPSLRARADQVIE